MQHFGRFVPRVATPLRRTLTNIVSRLKHDSSCPINEKELEDEEYQEISSEFIGTGIKGHGVLVLQPHVKWGHNKKRNTTPQLQLEEAVSLIRTLRNWKVVETMLVPLLSLERKALLGSGGLENLQRTVWSNPEITAVFVSTNVLKPVQMQELKQLLDLPIFDRYSIVIQIFREHAKTPEAKLQVALAELPYVWQQMSETKHHRGGMINFYESRKKILEARENKLKNALKKLEQHRQLIRTKRKTVGIPTVAVVGYTNAGKTSLIKALTGKKSLQPEDKLFATLDTTAHEGLLPCRLKVLFVDTIGFIQDVPEALLQPFVVTLRDALGADVIVHVYDVSHPDKNAQIEHVEKTISGLNIDNRPVINIANKCDLVEGNIGISDSSLAVSAEKLIGIDLLRQELEKKLLKATGRSKLRVRVESGSSAANWLYKEMAVVDAQADPKDAQHLLVDVIATELQLIKFKQFLKKH